MRDPSGGPDPRAVQDGGKHVSRDRRTAGTRCGNRARPTSSTWALLMHGRRRMAAAAAAHAPGE
jgi:hypothetical protein